MASQPPKKKAKIQSKASAAPAAHMILTPQPGPQGSKKGLQARAKNAPQVSGQSMTDVSGGRFVGTIKHCDPSRGIGKIECVDAKALYGCDISFIPSSGLDVGDEVSFSVALDSTGKPSVRQLMRWLPPADPKKNAKPQLGPDEGEIPDDDTEPPDEKELAQQLQEADRTALASAELDEAEALRSLQQLSMPEEEESLDAVADFVAAAAEWSHLGEAGPKIDSKPKEGLKKSDLPDAVQQALDALLPNQQTVIDMSATIVSTERPDASLMLLKKTYGWFWSSHAAGLQNDFLSTGGYKSLVSALRANRSNREVCYWLCNVIAGATNGKTPALTTALVKAGVVQEVSDIVTRSNDDEALQLAAATALGYLARDTTARNRIAASGIVEQVMKSVEQKLG